MYLLTKNISCHNTMKKKRIYENVPMKGSKFYMRVCSRPSRRNKYFDLTSNWFLSWLVMFSPDLPIKIYWRRLWLHFKFTETIVLPHHWNESLIKNNCTFNSEMTSEFESLDKLKYHNLMHLRSESSRTYRRNKIFTRRIGSDCIVTQTIILLYE